MAFEKLSDIPSDRPLNLAERKALMRELEDAKARLICAESLLEVAVEFCKDELKKRIDAAARANQKGLSIVRICQVMGVARSSFYHKQKISILEIRDNQLAQWIKLIEVKFFYTIGRRMGALIKREFGQEVSEGRSKICLIDL